jgi:hypothetical protein
MLYNVSITYDNGKTVNEITHSSNPFTINPKQDGITSCKVIVHKYEIEHHLPPTIFISPTNNKKYLIPMWIEIHPDTTYDDVKWIKPKQKKIIEHIEGSMGKYKTTYDPNKKTYKCTCMGFWRSKGNCKHVKSLRENNK